MTPRQRSYCAHLRVFAILLVTAVAAMALMGGYGETPSGW